MSLRENLSAAWRAFRGEREVHRVLVRRPDQDIFSELVGSLGGVVGGAGGLGGVGAYAGGEVSRLDADFNPTLVGPNMTAEQTLALGRARSTTLCEDNDVISGAQNTVVNNVVGPSGISPQPNTGDRGLDNQIRDLWWSEAGGVDVSRELPIGESQREWVSEMFRVGEGMASYPIVPAWNGYDAGPAVEIIDTDRMPINDWRLSAPGRELPGVTAGNFVRQGVEVDKLGRRHAYHVLEQHPSDNAFWTNPASALKTIRLSAAQCRLGFRRAKSRPGTLRGVPWTIAVIETSRMLAGFQTAAMAQARLAASLGLIFVGTNGRPLRTGDQESAPFVDSDGQPISKLRAGMIGRTAENGDVKTIGTNLPGPGLSMAEEVLLRHVAAGLGISYSVLARDYSRATFSATRAESLEDRKGYRTIQELLVIHHTEPFYRRKLDWWLLSGKLNLTPEQELKARANPSWLYRVVWIMPGWEWVNPQQEAQASQIGLDGGFLDLYTVCSQTGRHAEDVVDARLRIELYEIEERKRLKLPPKSSGAPKPATDPNNDPSQAEDAAPEAAGDAREH